MATTEANTSTAVREVPPPNPYRAAIVHALTVLDGYTEAAGDEAHVGPLEARSRLRRDLTQADQQTLDSEVANCEACFEAVPDEDRECYHGMFHLGCYIAYHGWDFCPSVDTR